MTPLVHRDRPTYVYLLMDVHGAVIYVGVTNNPRGRRADHRNRWWWEEVADWRLIGPFLDRERAEVAERHYIAHHCPMFNTQGVPRERLHVWSETEMALSKAWRDYQYCMYGGRIVDGRAADAAAALARVERLRQRMRRERLTLLQGGAA